MAEIRRCAKEGGGSLRRAFFRALGDEGSAGARHGEE
jgi:hypothetical protein